LQNKKSFRIYALIFATIAIVMILINLYDYFLAPKNFTNIFVPSAYNLKYESDSSPSIYVFEESIFFTSKDSTKLIDEKGKTVWEETYTLNYPTVISENKYVLVTERMNVKAYLFDNNGMLYDFSEKIEFPIAYAALNKNGYCSFILKESEKDFLIQIFDTKGNSLLKIPQTSNNIFPLSLDVSDDNRILAFSTLDIGGAEMVSHVMLYFLNQSESVEKANSKLISGSSEKNQIISKVKFMKGNNLICISDNKITCKIEKDGVPFEDVFSLELNNKIRKLIFNSDESFSYMLGEPLLNVSENAKTELPQTIKTIDLSGNETVSFLVDKNINVDYMNFSHDMFIVGDGNEFNFYNRKGELEFSHSATSNLRQVSLYKNKKNLVALSPNELNFYNYKKIRKAD